MTARAIILGLAVSIALVGAAQAQAPVPGTGTRPAAPGQQPPRSGPPVAGPQQAPAARPPAAGAPAATTPRVPRSFEFCNREAMARRYRGAERRHFVSRCQLGYGRRLFRRRGPAAAPLPGSALPPT